MGISSSRTSAVAAAWSAGLTTVASSRANTAASGTAPSAKMAGRCEVSWVRSAPHMQTRPPPSAWNSANQG